MDMEACIFHGVYFYSWWTHPVSAALFNTRILLRLFNLGDPTALIKKIRSSNSVQSQNSTSISLNVQVRQYIQICRCPLKDDAEFFLASEVLFFLPSNRAAIMAILEV